MDKAHKLLKQHGATLKRWKKHEVWQLPNGAVITLSKSPSDYRVLQNQLKDIERALKCDSLK